MFPMTWKEVVTPRGEIRPASSVGAPHKRDRLWFMGNSGTRWMRSGDRSQEAMARQFSTTRKGTYCAREFKEQSTPAMWPTPNAGRPGTGEMGESINSAPRGDGQTNQSFYAGSRVQWIQCPDGKSRPVESSICLLAHGIQHRAPILHAFGNAIVPQVAAEFIKSTMEITCQSR